MEPASASQTDDIMPPKPASKGAKKAASFFKLDERTISQTTTATKRVVWKDKHSQGAGQSGAVETSHTAGTDNTKTDTVTQVGSIQPSSQFTFVDIPLFNVHDDVDFKKVKARTRRRATRAATISAAGEKTEQSRPPSAVSNYFATLDPVAISGSSGDSESDVPPTAAQRPRRPTPPPATPPPPPPQQPAGSTSVREPTVVLKLEGEDRPFPSAPEVLQGVLDTLKKEGITIDGLVRTGACFHEVWPQKPSHTERILGALDGTTILRWQVSARRVGERLPMYVVLNDPGGSRIQMCMLLCPSTAR